MIPKISNSHDFFNIFSGKIIWTIVRASSYFWGANKGSNFTVEGSRVAQNEAFEGWSAKQYEILTPLFSSHRFSIRPIARMFRMITYLRWWPCNAFRTKNLISPSNCCLMLCDLVGLPIPFFPHNLRQLRVLHNFHNPSFLCPKNARFHLIYRTKHSRCNSKAHINWWVSGKFIVG